MVPSLHEHGVESIWWKSRCFVCTQLAMVLWLLNCWMPQSQESRGINMDFKPEPHQKETEDEASTCLHLITREGTVLRNGWEADQDRAGVGWNAAEMLKVPQVIVIASQSETKNYNVFLCLIPLYHTNPRPLQSRRHEELWQLGIDSSLSNSLLTTVQEPKSQWLNGVGEMAQQWRHWLFFQGP